MKEYLQLEGMVYKLVPIRTIRPKRHGPTRCGYVIMNDQQSSLTYTMILKQERTVLTTVPIFLNQLILEGKKQANIINLAMTKTVEYFL
jgi:hypothetical protein